jgi:DNA-directed RNA polymerase II subunit RPB4
MRERAWLTWDRTITQFLDYLDNFARYKEEDSLHSIAALFDAHPELTVVEKALLGNNRTMW